MMMTHEKTPAPRALDSGTLERARAALAHCLREGRVSDQAATDLSRLAAEAREKEIPPERLLIILKDLWRSSPDVENATRSAKNEPLRRDVITLCIEAYYGSRSTRA